MLEADLGGGRWLVTDDTWQATVLQGWTATAGHGISGRGIEQLDARSLPVDWLDEDPGWPAALQRRAMTAGEPGRPEPPSYPIGPFGPRPISWPDVTEIPLADEGDGAHGTDRIVVGTLVAEVDGPPGATVTVRTAEFRDADGRPAPTEHDAGVTVTLDGTPRTVESLDAYGCQGALVELSDGAALRSLAIRERVHPVRGEAAFRCSDHVAQPDLGGRSTDGEHLLDGCLPRLPDARAAGLDGRLRRAPDGRPHHEHGLVAGPLAPPDGRLTAARRDAADGLRRRRRALRLHDHPGLGAALGPLRLEPLPVLG